LPIGDHERLILKLEPRGARTSQEVKSLPWEVPSPREAILKRAAPAQPAISGRETPNKGPLSSARHLNFRAKKNARPTAHRHLVPQNLKLSCHSSDGFSVLSREKLNSPILALFLPGGKLDTKRPSLSPYVDRENLNQFGTHKKGKGHVRQSSGKNYCQTEETMCHPGKQIVLKGTHRHRSDGFNEAKDPFIWDFAKNSELKQIRVGRSALNRDKQVRGFGGTAIGPRSFGRPCGIRVVGKIEPTLKRSDEEVLQ